MKASITIKDPIVEDVFLDWYNDGYIIDLTSGQPQRGLPDIQVQIAVSHDPEVDSGNALTDFVTNLLLLAGVDHYEFGTRREIKPVVHWESGLDFGGTEDSLLCEQQLEYATL